MRKMGDITGRMRTLDGAPARAWDDYATTAEGPEPLPAPGADFTITPSNPTMADDLVSSASLSTPAEHIER
jgi:hypothetical protein